MCGRENKHAILYEAAVLKTEEPNSINASGEHRPNRCQRPFTKHLL